MDRYRQSLDAFVEAFGVRHDAHAVAELYTEDAVLVDNSTGDRVQSRKAIEEWYAVYLRAFPDVTVQYHNVFGSGDMAAGEWITRGTHTGPLATPQGEIAPTGKRVELRGCSISKFAPGGIMLTEDSNYFDSASLLQQLGVM
jgi:steroid delta-isomerase-like uncharacterized protein